MSKRILTIATVMVVMGLSSSAFAQDDGKTRTKFYDFNDMLIDGEFKKPDIMANKAKDKARFKRLSSLKKSFLPKVRKTTDEGALQ